jgi:hypothetical protein
MEIAARQNLHDDPMHGFFGGHDRRMREELRQRQQNIMRDRTLEEIINIQCKTIAEEAPTDDIISALQHQVVNNEKILEILLQILLTNNKLECDLIPCLQALTKLQNNNGVPVIRNKIVNMLTFLLKAIATGDTESLKTIIPQHDIQDKKTILILIGTLRLLLKQNKSLMKFILKGLIVRDDASQGKGISTQIMKKQFKALSLKSNIAMDQIIQEEPSSSIDTSPPALQQ